MNVINIFSVMLKTIFCAFFTVSSIAALPLLAQHANLATKPFPLCNLIMVKTSDNTEVIRHKLKESFFRQGYVIISSDAWTITGKIEIENEVEETVTAVMMNSTISYAGTCSYTRASAAQLSRTSSIIPETARWTIEYKGKNDSATRAAFAKMNSLASAYGGKTYYFFQ